MEQQLTLLDDGRGDWRLDDETKAVGLQGIAEAREVLRRARAETRASGERRDHPHAA